MSESPFTASGWATPAFNSSTTPRQRDLLADYDDWRVIVRAMHSITRRLNKSELDDAVASVSASLLEDLEVDFLGYFPEVIDHAADWIRKPGVDADKIGQYPVTPLLPGKKVR